jgi:glycosyltransferase involved in cell wall biosynthesis
MVVENKKPLISVVVLCYNQENTIARTLDSIVSQQTEYSFEIIIGEDASPNDNTRAICEEYVAKYPQIIRILPKAVNKGILKNYSDCIAECKGEYIAICAGDDWWHNPEKLQLQVEFLEINPDFGLVHTEADIHYPISDNIYISKGVRNCPEGEVFEKLLTVNFIYAATVLYRRKLLQYADFQKWISLNFVAEDHAMWLAFSSHTLFHYYPISTITYSATLDSISRPKNFEKRLEFVKGICKIQLYFYDMIKPTSPSYSSVIKYQKRWLINELLANHCYSKLKEFGAPLHTRLFPSFYFISCRVISKLKRVLVFLLMNKKSVDFI